MINLCFRKHGAIQYKLSRRAGLELNSNDFTIFFNIPIYKTVYEIKCQFCFGGLQSKAHSFLVTEPTSTGMSPFYLESNGHTVMIQERSSLPSFLRRKRYQYQVSRYLQYQGSTYLRLPNASVGWGGGPGVSTVGTFILFLELG